MYSDRIFTNEMFLKSLNREPQLFEQPLFDRSYGNSVANQRLLRDRFAAADEVGYARDGADPLNTLAAFCG